MFCIYIKPGNYSIYSYFALYFGLCIFKYFFYKLMTFNLIVTSLIWVWTLGLFVIVERPHSCCGNDFPSYLSPHCPGSQHMAAEVELFGFHLVVTGAAVLWYLSQIWCTLKHFDMMHDGFVTWSYHRLILEEIVKKQTGFLY